MRVLVATIIAGLVVTAVPVGTAGAQPPTNDNYAQRAALAFGASVVVDTSEATVETLDVEATSVCPSPPGPPPATTNTVWFDYESGATPPPEARITLSNATFPSGAAVVTGEPGSFSGVGCGPSTVTFAPAANTTYHVLIFDFLGLGGGTVTVSLGEPPPPPTLDLTIDPTGRFDPKTGTATISGTYVCTNAFFVSISGNVRQRAGRLFITGTFSTFDVQCDGVAHPWSAEVVGANGRFAGGKAMTVAFGFSCGSDFCVDAFVEQTVHLRGGTRS